MTDTAKSAREIIANAIAWTRAANMGSEQGADKAIAALRAAGFQIVATPAVGEVSDAKKKAWEVYQASGRMSQYSLNLAIDAIAPRLKAEGLREGLTRALEISRKHEQALDVEVAIFNEIARADALEKGEA